MLGVGLLLVVGGCAYYNGLYNANRLVKAAQKADREGRPGEATALWAQAAVKAESVVTRYPRSKHRDDAGLLHGRALQASGQCARAIEPLEATVAMTPDARIKHAAQLTLGKCLLNLGRPDSAIAVLSPVVTGQDSQTVWEARLWRGRAFMALANHHRAIRDLEQSMAEGAAFPLAVAYSRVGRSDDAARVLDPQVSRPFREVVWLATLDSLAEHRPELSADLTDRLVARSRITEGERARLLLIDGKRWRRLGDDRRAEERFAAAVVAAPDSVEGREARAERLFAALRQSNDLGHAAAILDTLRDPRPQMALPPSANEAKRILERAVGTLVADSTAATEFLMFLAAEQVRDSLGALPLAARIFGEIPARYPSSVIAPKALLAAAAIDAQVSDSLLGILQARYATSPHALALRGLGGDAFRAIEDSILGLLGFFGSDGELSPGVEGVGVRERGATETKPKKPGIVPYR